MNVAFYYKNFNTMVTCVVSILLQLCIVHYIQMLNLSVNIAEAAGMSLPDTLSVVGVLHQPSSPGNRQDRILMRTVPTSFNPTNALGCQMFFCYCKLGFFVEIIML